MGGKSFKLFLFHFETCLIFPSICVVVLQHTWALSKLAIQDSGEIPALHVYEIQPVLEKKTEPSKNDGADDVQSKTELDVILPVKYSYLALSQRKLDFVPNPFLHPFQPCVFGSPLLVRVRDLEGYTGKELYALISKQMQRFVPYAPINNDHHDSSSSREGTETTSTVSRQARRGRQYR